MTKKNLPVITTSDWLEAEQTLCSALSIPQPKGSITTRQYAEIINRSIPTARHRLSAMVRIGMATSERWGTGAAKGRQLVYFLNPKHPRASQ